MASDRQSAPTSPSYGDHQKLPTSPSYNPMSPPSPVAARSAMSPSHAPTSPSLSYHGHAPASPQSPSPASPAQSPSEDGFSVVSHTEILDPESISHEVNDAPVQQPHISSSLNRMTELNNTPTLKLSQLRTQHDEVQRQLGTQITDQQDKDTSIREQLKTLSHTINKPIPDIPSLIQSYEHDTQALSSLQWTVDTLRDHIRLLHRQKQENLSETARLTLDNTTLTAKTASLTEELTALKTDTISASSQAASDAHTFSTLHSNTHLLETRIASLTQQTADLTHNLTTLKSANATLTTQNTKLKHTISKRDTTITDLKDEIWVLKSHEHEIQTLHDEIARLEAVTEDLRDGLADRYAEVEEGKPKLHNARWRGRRLKKQRDGARAAKAAEAAEAADGWLGTGR